LRERVIRRGALCLSEVHGNPGPDDQDTDQRGRGKGIGAGHLWAFLSFRDTPGGPVSVDYLSAAPYQFTTACL
jgi:hypothetical protein